MAKGVKLNGGLRTLRKYSHRDMSMFTLGEGGVHCLCQALKREPVQV